MKISVVTPSFNQAQFLETTILSVLNQNYSDFEYIIIDGGSSDGSVEIIKKYEKHLAYWISEKDKGQSHAINKGFRKATGQILGWINSDDYYEVDCFRKVAEAFQQDENIGLVYGYNNLRDEYGNFLGVYAVLNISVNKLLRDNPNVVQPGSFYRKRILDLVGFLDEDLHYVMDFDLWVRLGQVSKICQIPEPLASFRWHTKSKTRSQRISFSLETLAVKNNKYGIKKICWQNRIVLYRLLRDKLISWL